MTSIESIIRTTEEIAREVAAPNAETVDNLAQWPSLSIESLQSAGLAAMVVPESYGGGGHGLLALSRVCEILGRECASSAICFGMHSVGASVISTNPSDKQREMYLEPIVAGKHITTLSLSEAGTGAHFYLPQTRLETHDGGFTLQGKKTFVTNGGHADSYVVSTVSNNDSTPMGQFSCVVVPRDSNGLSWGDRWSGLGMRGNSSRSMLLENVRLPQSSLLGQEGDQIWYIFNVVCPYFLTAMSGTFLGIMSSALEDARRHLETRQHTHVGLTLAQAPVLQHRLGEMWAQVERTRRLIYHAARSFDAGDPDALIALMSAKVEVAESVVSIVNEAMTMVGGISYRDGSRLHRFMRDARACHLMSPTTDILKIWTGRALLGQPLLAE
ncbi:MAG: acyl-CoA dehydrogenase family protein [Granulosicoccus sp.]